MKNKNSDNKRIAFDISRLKNMKSRYVLPVGIGGTVVVILLALRLTGLIILGYLLRDGFAIPSSDIAGMLSFKEGYEAVRLKEVAAGDTIFAKSEDAADYYIGEDELGIKAGMPIYSDYCQVMTMVDSKTSLITEDFKTLYSYPGLSVTDGITYNQDGTQADQDKIMLLASDGAYFVTQEASVVSKSAIAQIPMNSFCSFRTDSLVYYYPDIRDGYVLIGDIVAMNPNSKIKIGDKEYDYKDFLDRLGLWQESNKKKDNETIKEPVVEQEEVVEETEPEVTEDESLPNDNRITGKDIVRIEKDKDGEANTIEREHRPSSRGPGPAGASGSSAGSGDLQMPADAAPSIPSDHPETYPSEKEKEPSDNKPANPDYVEPIIELGPLDSGVYYIKIPAIVEDPAKRFKKRLQVSAYEVLGVDEEGTEIVAKAASSRVVIGADGNYYLSTNIKPDTTYQLQYEYSYLNEYGRTVSVVSNELGSITTHSRDEIEPIGVTFNDDTKSDLPVYSNRIIAGGVLFDDVFNGSTVANEDSKGERLANQEAISTYINRIEITFFQKNSDGSYKNTPIVKTLSSKALSLLKKGYAIEEVVLGENMKSGSEFAYYFKAYDSFGEELVLKGDSSVQIENLIPDGYISGLGHTSLVGPTVSINIPTTENVAGSVRMDVTFNNPDAVTMSTGDSEFLDDQLTAGLFVVPSDMDITPDNAIAVKAYRIVEGQKEFFDGKFLPINTDEHNAKSSWIITSLPTYKNYTAAVLAGGYDIADRKVYKDIVLEKQTPFVTALLSNLGRVAFITDVLAESITADKAELRMRMDKVDKRLLPLLDSIEFELTDEEGNSLGSVMLHKPDLEAVPLKIELDENGDVIKEITVSVPVHVNGNINITQNISMKIGWDREPSAYAEGVDPFENLWNYILSTSTTKAVDKCYFAITAGERFQSAANKMFELKPRSKYTGTFKVMASQGGNTEDVTANRAPVVFSTKAQEAYVEYSHIFVSNDFIEIYDLQIADVDGCVLEDTAQRGGMVAAKVFTESGVLANVKYIDTNEKYPSIRIDRLSKNENYILEFDALRYQNTGYASEDRAIIFDIPDNPEEPYIYRFTTGESVYGKISLNGISQVYIDENGNHISEMNILTPTDFYEGVAIYNNYTYYLYDYSGNIDGNVNQDKLREGLERYHSQAEIVEKDETAREYVKTQESRSTALLYGSTSANAVTKKALDDGTAWMTRFIPVEPGEEYVMYNNFFAGSSYDNITFYDNDFNYKSVVTGGYLQFNGNKFSIPSGISYMRISSTQAAIKSDVILTKYNPSKTESKENMAAGIGYTLGRSLTTTGGDSVNASYAYTNDYIPVIGGNVYELGGRDPSNKSSANTVTKTSDLVLFYDANYTFQGAYSLPNQHALIKAPFNSAYMRFNVRQYPATGGYALRDNEVFLKEYLGTSQGEYLVSLQATLNDNSETQIMRDVNSNIYGEYAITVYVTPGKVSDKTDLTQEGFDYLDPVYSYKLNANDFKNGKLDLNRILDIPGLAPERGYMVELSVKPVGWDAYVVLDTTYFTTNRVAYVIYDNASMMAVRNDPAGSYIVIADIVGDQKITAQILGSDRPFTGVIDYQGHKVETAYAGSMFETISKDGVLKNGIIEYSPNVRPTYDAASGNRNTYYSISGKGGLATTNRGTINNFVVKLNPNSNLDDRYPVDMRDSGGIVRVNYGIINGFVVEFMKDIHVSIQFGGVCFANYGVVQNGYVCADPKPSSDYKSNPYLISGDEPRLIHTRYEKDKDSGTYKETAEQSTQYLGYIVGYNYPQGEIYNVFSVGDLVVESASANNDNNNADFQKDNSDYETSTTNTAYAGLLAGRNDGMINRAFTTGDRLDYSPVNNQWSYMRNRGPAVPYTNVRYETNNVTYFSNGNQEYNSPFIDVSFMRNGIPYNSKGEMESLYDYQWYATVLGDDGDAFEIRNRVDASFYPQLLLPNSFDLKELPNIPLPNSQSIMIEVTNNIVRLQGKKQALVTVTLDTEVNVSSIRIEDDNQNVLSTEILAQNLIGKEYKVDLLVTLSDNAMASDRYYITQIIHSQGVRDWATFDEERTVFMTFWNTISNVAEWKNKIAAATDGNFRLIADIDFSESLTYKDWYNDKNFYGNLDGGIYSTVNQELTDSLNMPILVKGSDSVRTIEADGELIGMHSIKGVGNFTTDSEGNKTYVAGRQHDYNYTLFLYLRGVIKNVLFTNFECISDGKTTGRGGVRTTHAGIIYDPNYGAKIINCHVRDSEFIGSNYVGSLAAKPAATTIINCSVADTSVTSYRYGSSVDSVSIGGLVGLASGSYFEGCFADNVAVNSDKCYASNGTGGLIGRGSSVLVNDCYVNVQISSSKTQVGGVIGWLGDVSEVHGCISTGSMVIVADSSGGIVGTYSAGQVTNNLSAITIINRSVTAQTTHRICSSTIFNENNLHSNYAYAGQNLTYTEDGKYNFGSWDKLDGATQLLTASQLSNPATWMNLIGVGSCYDIIGMAKSYSANPVGGFSISGGSRIHGVDSGYYPKLMDTDTQVLLYDQPDIFIGGDNEAILQVVDSGNPSSDAEFDVQLWFYSPELDNNAQGDPDSKVAKWDELTIIGADVISVSDANNRFIEQRNGKEGIHFTANIKLTSYYDSYIVTLPLSSGDVVQNRITFTNPIYKDIHNIQEWNDFFTDHKDSFENVRIAQSVSHQGRIDFSKANNPNDNQYNVTVNRMIGDEGAVITGINKNFSDAGNSLIAQVSSGISNITFEDITLNSYVENASTGAKTYYGGNYKGIIGMLTGDIKDVSFKNINIHAGSSAYAGCVGYITGEADNVYMSGINVHNRSSYAGGLSGYATETSTIKNILMDGNVGRNEIISENNSYVGGIVAYTLGICKDIVVKDTDVQGITYVGGVAGCMYGNAGRPEEYKSENIYVGAGSRDEVEETSSDHSAPGVLQTPSVSVKLDYDSSTNVANYQRAGGVVGDGNNQRYTNLNVFNTLIEVARVGTSATTAGYASYVGGIMGANSTYLYDSTAENCTIQGTHGYTGGISGTSINGNNLSKENVVYCTNENATGGVGGLIGNGNAYTSNAQHCIVIAGNNAGGIGGNTSTVDRCGTSDSIIIATLGGAGGVTGYNTAVTYNCFVTASVDAEGDNTVETYLSTDDVPGCTYFNKNAAFSGSYIEGGDYVGGIAGKHKGVLTACYVSKGTDIVGKRAVGGIIGSLFPNTTSRAQSQSAFGGRVTGEKFVGGTVGLFEIGAGTELIYMKAPSAAYIYGHLVTGDVYGPSDSTDIIIGSVGTLTGGGTKVANDGKSYISCRVYEKSKIGNDSTQASSLVGYWRDNTTNKGDTLYVTSDDLRYDYTYFRDRITTSNYATAAKDVTYGMAWSRLYWDDSTLNQMYEGGYGASFDAYSSGINKNGLVLWLDARNNTGYGYTDADATEWKDLSVKKNNAILRFNNKERGEAATYNEIVSGIRWQDGSFFKIANVGATYSARLENLLNDYLDDGVFTVEMITAVGVDSLNNVYKYPLRWGTATTTNGFADYYYTKNSTGTGYYPHIYHPSATGSAAGALGRNNEAVRNAVKNGTTYRTSTYTYKIENGIAEMSYYYQGNRLDRFTNSSANYLNLFYDVPTSWYINGTEQFVKVLGIRVYDRVLAETEIMQNAQYDNWYYFAGEKPYGANSISGGSITSGDLFITSSRNYNGTLLQKGYSGDMSELPRGYYYIRNGNSYSSIVERNQDAITFGPRLRSVSPNNTAAVLSVLQTKYLEGQEGQDSNAVLNDCEDGIISGGYIMPNPDNYDPMEINERACTQTLLTASAMSFNAKTMMNRDETEAAADLPQETDILFYSSGIDTVNFEVPENMPDGTVYRISQGGEVYIAGIWPSGERTITIQWNYDKPLTITLEKPESIDVPVDDEKSEKSGNDSVEATFTYRDAARSVMTWGDTYYYLHGSEIYNANGESLDKSVEFIHMSDGKFLDAKGNIYNIGLDVVGHVGDIQSTDRRAMWSGIIMGQMVEDYASYIVVNGEVRDETLLFARGGYVYTVPSKSIVPWSFMLDTYGDDMYTTVLGIDGELVDMGSELVYPDDFSKNGIREISNNLNYNGNMLLVRYNSGMLVAFNYLNGEKTDVISDDKEAVDFMDYLTAALNGITGNRGLLSGGAGIANSSVEYQKEVNDDASLKTALVALGGNPLATKPTDGTGEGINSDDPVNGLQGDAVTENNDGVVESTVGFDASGEGIVTTGEGSGELADQIGSVISDVAGFDSQAEGVVSEGVAVGYGDSTELGNATDGAAEGAITEGVNGVSDINESSINRETTEAENVREDTGVRSDSNDILEEFGKSGVAAELDTLAEESIEKDLKTEYITVFDPLTGETLVYNLEEYLSSPEGYAISENSKMSKLKDMGFTTSLSNKKRGLFQESQGFVLMLLATSGFIVLIVLLYILRKKRFDRD